MANELTPEEIKFFETGDASHLQPAAAAAPPPVEAAPPAPPAEPPVAAPPPADPAAELARQVAADRAQRAQLEARIAAIQQQITDAAKPPPPAAPDRAADPLGAMFHDLNTLKESLSSLQARLDAANQEAEQKQQYTSFATEMQRLKSEFMKATPDFTDAYAHLRSVRADDLRDVGVPEDQIPQALLQDEIAIAVAAQQRGKNPAQVIYDMAKRAGYRAAPAAAPAPSPAEKIELAQRAAAAAAPQRGASDAPLTFAGLKDASDTDLSRVAQDDKLWHSVVGNRTNSIF